MPSPPDELIIARATAPGAGAVAIVRVDGAGAAELAGRLFTPFHGAPPARRPREMVYGAWREPASGELIDAGLTVFFKGPRSYTGNDMAEFHCHGGAAAPRQLIAAGLALGARLAGPGEFTRRAFLNGRMDLAQAEAVADLINAQTAAAARLAGRQLAGALSERVREAREGLLTLAAEIEARIDFPEEDLAGADRERLERAFRGGLEALEALLATRRRGRLLREGARVALTGRPNAGKSSLLNALARAERAIVTPRPGTTRDAIECAIELAGVPVTLIDTAGLRASNDPVERIGIERALEEAERADFVLLVRDAAAPAEELAGRQGEHAETDGASPAPRRAPDLIALNKIDLLPPGAPRPAAGGDTVAVSAVTGEGLAGLEARLAALVQGSGASETASEFAINLRHGELLEQARAALASAQGAFAAGQPGELAMIDLREALDALGAILGVELGDAILDRIFSQFCIGK